MGSSMRGFTFCVAVCALTLAGASSGCAQVARIAGQAKYQRSGNELRVPGGGDLQGALNDAKPGETIILEAGAIYRGRFTMPEKSGEGWITIRTSAVDKLPPADYRVKPEHAAAMPKLICRDCPVLSAAKRAHHFRLLGLEIYPEDGVYADTLVAFGDGQETVEADLPHDFEIDRSILHGDPKAGSKRGVGFQGKSLTVKNSHLVDFFSNHQDAQAILGYNGPGPFWIVNNHLEASGENVMFGGAAPRIPGVIPSDIQILRNHFYKPERLRGVSRIKNLLEFKNAQRVKVEGNILENNWPGAQNGYGVLFTVRTCEAGDYSWARVAEIEFRNNILRNSEHGFNFLGRDDVRGDCGGPRIAGEAKDIAIVNNLVDGTKTALQILSGTTNLRFEHNTVLNTGMAMRMEGVPSPGAVFLNNIFAVGMFAGDARREGSAGFDYLPGVVFKENVLVGLEHPQFYPGDNYMAPKLADVGFVSMEQRNWALGPKSKLRGKATTKKDIGADFGELEKATKGVLEGVPADK